MLREFPFVCPLAISSVLVLYLTYSSHHNPRESPEERSLRAMDHAVKVQTCSDEVVANLQNEHSIKHLLRSVLDPIDAPILVFTRLLWISKDGS